jgi:hypothetical protein
MNAITNRLHNSFKIKDNSLTRRNYEEFFIEIDYFCVSKLSIDLFFKLPASRFLAINIEGKIGQLTVRRTSSFIKKTVLHFCSNTFLSDPRNNTMFNLKPTGHGWKKEEEEGYKKFLSTYGMVVHAGQWFACKST